MQQARQPIPRFPNNIVESDDMVVILNARATVLLNASFRELRQQKQVIKLAALALELWQRRNVRTNWDEFMSESNTTDEQYAYIIQKLLLLIRNDIYQYLTSAIQEFHNTERVEQEKHIDVFLESANTWRKMINRQIEATRGHEHPIETGAGFNYKMSKSRHH
jgi:hypothetical protein